MKKTVELSVRELTEGFICSDGVWECVECGMRFERGEIFAFGDRFFEAERAVREHVRREHPARLEALLERAQADGLSENRGEYLRLAARGLSDGEIARLMHVTPATVRGYRFSLREKARSAKLYLAAFELAMSGETPRGKDEVVLPQEGVKMMDDRFVMTEEEREKIERGIFESFEPLKLKLFSAKEKKKVVAISRIAREFEAGRRDTEKEVNEILKGIYHDYVTIRRYLIEYGYLDRERDCSEYWLSAR